MDNRQRYRVLCDTDVDVPLFSQAWWLDAVCGDSWDVVLVEQGGQVQAAMPYYMFNKYGFKFSYMPPLTQSLGPWIRAVDAKVSTKLGREKELMSALIEKLPRFDALRQSWNYRYTNWQPFYWQGFSQTTRYTYVLPDLTDLDAVWGGVQDKTRCSIRKSMNRFSVKVDDNCTLDEFLNVNRKTFSRQGLAVPYTDALVRQIDRACEIRGCRKIFRAIDPEGHIHAVAYIVWDDEVAYYLMGGGDPEFRSSGAASQVLWEAIRFASGVTKYFDFEGSMIEPVERFFRAFGALQVPYFSVSKVNSVSLAAAFAVRDAIKLRRHKGN